jgi:hypothetical protein
MSHVSESYLEDLQLLFDRYRRGIIDREELERGRLALMARSGVEEGGVILRGLRGLVYQRSLVFAAAVCALFLVSSMGFLRFLP